MEYELRIGVASFFGQHQNEMIQVMQCFYKHSAFTFEDEIKRCLTGNTNHVILYALSRLLRCTIHHWVIYLDQAEGKVQLKLTPLIPPIQVDKFKRIEILELVCQTSSEFCLLIPNIPQAQKHGVVTTSRIEETQPKSQKVTQVDEPAPLDLRVRKLYS